MRVTAFLATMLTATLMSADSAPSSFVMPRLDDMRASADVVVIGHLTEVVVEDKKWRVPGAVGEDPLEWDLIMTRQRLTIARVVEGDYEEPEISFYTWGGVKDDRFAKWSHSPTLPVETPLLVFLEESHLNPAWIITYHRNGVYELDDEFSPTKIENFYSDHDHAPTKGSSRSKRIEKLHEQLLSLAEPTTK